MLQFSTKITLGFVPFICISGSAFAATWEQSLALPFSLEYESNPRLVESNRQSVRRSILTPEYSLTVSRDTDQWFARTRLRIERSSDRSVSADREDPLIDVGWTRELETGQFGLTAHFEKQSTRTSEFDDTGLVSNDNTRRTRSLAASWINALDDRYTLTVNADVTKVTFDESASGLNDFNNEAISAQLGYSINEQVESFARLSFSRFDPDNTNKTNFRSLDIGASWSVSDRFSLTGSAGVNDTSGASSESGWQAMLDMQYMTLRTRSGLSLSRTRSPSGTGIINESNQVMLDWSYSYSETENIGFDVNWRENLDSNQGETLLFKASYTRQISPAWDFRLSAQHRNRDDVNSNASSNSLTATLIYNLSNF